MSSYPIRHFTQPDRKERLLAACPELDSIFRTHAEDRHIPGVAYGVILDGELIFDDSFGRRDVAVGQGTDEGRAGAVNVDTVFRIASMTKSFAALAILQLRDAGHLRLDEPAATYVPELAALSYPTADSAPVTVRQLLSMDVGWPQDDPWADRQLYQTDAALSDFYAEGVSWSNPPGMEFEYSNYSYMVLGRIITNVSGVPAVDYITQQILQPLGMTSTVWNADDVPVERLALGYRWEDEQWKPEALLPSGGDVAAFAGLFTTIRDLTRWVGLFLSAWPPRGEADEADDADEADEAAQNDSAHTVLCRSSLREMQRIWTVNGPSVSQSALGAKPALSAGGYGFGLSIKRDGRWTHVGHGGGLPGFGSYMGWLPEYGVGMVALSNLTYGGMSSAIGMSMERLLRGSGLLPHSLPIAPALAAAQDKLILLLDEWDDGLAAELFADNFLLDKDKAHWQETFAELHENHGALRLVEPYMDGAAIIPKNWLRGDWRMNGERGWCDFFISLSPTVPPRIQTLKVRSTLPPSTALQSAMAKWVALVNDPTKEALTALCAESLTANGERFDALWDQVRMANILCGTCQSGETLGGDGEEWIHFELVGHKCAINVRLGLDEEGRITNATMRP